MYILNYDEREKECLTVKEVIDTIKSLHSEYKLYKPHKLSILIDNKDHISLGIGDIENNSILIYEPHSSDKDCLVAYNPNSDNREEMGCMFYFMGIKTKHYLMWLIPFESILNEVEFFLNNKYLSKNLLWHAL